MEPLESAFILRAWGWIVKVLRARALASITRFIALKAYMTIANEQHLIDIFAVNDLVPYWNSVLANPDDRPFRIEFDSIRYGL